MLFLERRLYRQEGVYTLENFGFYKLQILESLVSAISLLKFAANLPLNDRQVFCHNRVLDVTIWIKCVLYKNLKPSFLA